MSLPGAVSIASWSWAARPYHEGAVAWRPVGRRINAALRIWVSDRTARRGHVAHFIHQKPEMNPMPRLWNRVDSCAVIVSDSVATGVSLLLACLLVMMVGGCAEIGQFGAADAQRATAIATTVGDADGAACWPILEATGKAVSAAGDQPSILVSIEEKRALQLALQNVSCQSVWAGALAELLKATPAAPLIP
jgi:hypothetical protein